LTLINNNKKIKLIKKMKFKIFLEQLKIIKKSL